MAKRKEQKSSKVLENPDVLRERLLQSEDFFVKHRNLVTSVFVVILVAIGAVVFWSFRKAKMNTEAQKNMYAAVLYFEADSLNKALEGDLKHPGLLDIAEKYSGTKSGKLASFYIGSIYLKQGSFDKAIAALQKFDLEDLLVQARAYALIGDAYMEEKKYDEALNYYRKAADYKPNPEFSPAYLMKAALAAELKNDYETAITLYDRIINQYPRFSHLTEAKKYKARAMSIIHSK